MNEVTPDWMIGQGFSPTFAKRFWAKVDKNGPIPTHRPDLGPCWIWIASRNWAGYGSIGPGRRKSGARGITAPRAGFMLQCGAIPDHKPFVLHKCDNPGCVRADHLFCGTQTDNMRDASNKGRVRYIVKRGEANPRHKLTASQVDEIRNLFGKLSQRKIAKRYGVTQAAISLIRVGKNWSHGYGENLPVGLPKL